MLDLDSDTIYFLIFPNENLDVEEPDDIIRLAILKKGKEHPSCAHVCVRVEEGGRGASDGFRG